MKAFLLSTFLLMACSQDTVSQGPPGPAGEEGPSGEQGPPGPPGELIYAGFESHYTVVENHNIDFPNKWLMFAMCEHEDDMVLGGGCVIVGEGNAMLIHNIGFWSTLGDEEDPTDGWACQWFNGTAAQLPMQGYLQAVAHCAR